MKLLWKVMFWILLGFLLILLTPHVVGLNFSQPANPLRFMVRLPELGLQQFEAPVVNLPHHNLSRLEVLIPKPFADQIPYGGIFLSINGQAANRIMDKVNTPAGKLLKVDLTRMPGFLFREGKNSLEVLTDLGNGQEFYQACILSTPYAMAAPLVKKAVQVEKFAGEKYALVIGISRYRFGNSLKFADADARAFRDFLLTKQGGGFQPENIQLLENEAATRGAIKKALDECVEKLRPEDLLVFFLAGHGGPDPNQRKTRYFMTTDTNEDFSATALSMSWLRDRLTKEIKAQRLICFIDTCHSAGIGGDGEEAVGMRSFGLNLINQDFENLLFGAPGIAVLTSSDINEKSYEHSRWDGHGVFTYYLLRGLKGEADFDQDRVVTAGELFEFVRSQVPSAVESYTQELRQKGSTAEFTGQHPRAAVGNNNGLQLALVQRAGT
ncbi:MAG: caspase family protein [Blastocatellia bacterium]|nr:caspase family protein [Blastocatellia bacterium]